MEAGDEARRARAPSPRERPCPDACRGRVAVVNNGRAQIRTVNTSVRSEMEDIS
jgi:hypothetical protein